MSRLRALATARPHLLVLEDVGGAAARLAVESFARRAGWPLVDTPADADVLVLAGPDAGLAGYADQVWDQLPGPRARVRVERGGDVPPLLEQARASLRDADAARADERRTQRPPAGMPGGDMSGHDMGGGDTGDDDPHAGHDMSDGDMAGHDTGDGDTGGHNMGDGDMAGHDMGGGDTGDDDTGDGDTGDEDPHAGHDMSDGGMAGHDMGGHAGHDMGGMDMPAGLAMADRADDRDGLKLDVLTVPWGPALTWWPAGLVVHTVLQGDVVQQVHVERLADPAAARDGWSAATRHLDAGSAAAVVRLDALAGLLAVAGWDGTRATAQRLRDDLLDGVPPADRASDLRRLARRVSRSRTLARMSRGLRAAGVDVVDRYRGWLDDVLAVLDGRPVAARPLVDDDALVTSLTGAEAGNARLIVAALGPELSGALQEQVAGV